MATGLSAFVLVGALTKCQIRRTTDARLSKQIRQDTRCRLQRARWDSCNKEPGPLQEDLHVPCARPDGYRRGMTVIPSRFGAARSWSSPSD